MLSPSLRLPRPSGRSGLPWLMGLLAGLAVAGGLPGAALAVVPVAAPQAAQASSAADADPYGSLAWPDVRQAYLGTGPVVFDSRVEVQGPAFAEDPMNVPISLRVDPALGPVEQVMVLVDRNPIRRVLTYWPLKARPALAFRFKLEQASPVRVAARTADGVWHVGSTWVDSAGGGCTVSGATRQDGSWSRTLGQVSGRLFTERADGEARLRLRVMHPMDTGLVGGVPAFFVNRLSVRDAEGHELARLLSDEPVSENPVFSFDFAQAPAGGVHIVGTDNNGNRIASQLE